MMKKRTLIVAILVFLAFSVSCDKEYGEGQMEDNLLTKEEFIQLIEDDAEYAAAGVTAQYFEDVDIEDFIYKYSINKEFLQEATPENMIWFKESYIRQLPSWEKDKKLAPYLVTELQ